MRWTALLHLYAFRWFCTCACVRITHLVGVQRRRPINHEHKPSYSYRGGSLSYLTKLSGWECSLGSDSAGFSTRSVSSALITGSLPRNLFFQMLLTMGLKRETAGRGTTAVYVQVRGYEYEARRLSSILTRLTLSTKKHKGGSSN